MKDQDHTEPTAMVEQLTAELTELRQRQALDEALQATRALRAERDKAQKYLDIAGAIIIAIDADQTITLANREGCKVLGYEEEEIVGKNWFDHFVPERHRDEVKAVFDRLMAGEIEPLEYFENPVLTRNGEERIIAWHNTILVDEAGNISGTLSSGTDITERKWAEKALQESEERFRNLVENMPIVCFMFDRQGRILSWNRAAERVYGYTKEEAVGASAYDLIVTPATREATEHVIREVFAGETVEGSEWQDRDKEGQVGWRMGNTFPLLYADGSVDRGVNLNIDITERKQAEEALRLYTERLKILREIDQSILTAESPKAIAEATLSHVRQLIPCQRAGVTLFDSSSGEMVVLAADTDVETVVREGTRERFDQFAGEIDVLRQDKVLILEEFQPRGEITAAMYAGGVRSFVAVPLIYQDELIGSLNLGMDSPDSLTFEHIDIARNVADSLAVAIQQARLREQVHRHAEELEQRVTDRTQELSVLYEIAALASQSLDLEVKLARSLEQVLETVKSEAGAIHLLDEADVPLGDGGSREERLRLISQQGIPFDLAAQIEFLPTDEGLGKWLVERDEPLVVSDITSDPRFSVVHPVEPYTYVGMPLRASGRTLGMFSIIRRVEQPPLNVEEFSLLTSVTDQLGIVVEDAQLRQRAEQAAVLEERERLARELHDSITQSLYSLVLFAEWGRDLFEDGEVEAAKQRLVRVGDTAQQALKEMRLLVYELRPALLEQDGLAKALQRRLEAVERRTGVEVSFHAESLGRLPAPVEEGLYRIAQEALNNALKHAAASSVTVRVGVKGKQVTLEVEDDGTGFALDAVSHEGGLGLISMQERAKRLGSELMVVSTPGEGTKVTLTVEVS